jgi:RNA polymerase sigma-70 factor, ECF subfamily
VQLQARQKSTEIAGDWRSVVSKIQCPLRRPFAVLEGNDSVPNAKQNDSALARVEKSIVSARDGSFTALGQLLDHYRDYLLQVANDELRSDLAVKVAPSDLVQETFLQAARRFPKFRGQSEAELRAWLRKILINKLHDANRHYCERQKREISREVRFDDHDGRAAQLADLENQQAQPREQLIQSERSARVQTAVAKLPESYRQVIELRHFERLSLQEIAERMNRSPEAARKLWCRAVERLICELAEHGSTGL